MIERSIIKNSTLLVGNLNPAGETVDEFIERVKRIAPISKKVYIFIDCKETIK